MRFFRGDEPAGGLFAHNVILTVNQSANGQPAFVSFGRSRHTGKFQQETRAESAYRELPKKCV
jgi:hypothetical protein